jgi:hypothetical protein
MPTHTLRYTSPEKLFILTKECTPFSGQIDQWRLSETFTPGTHPDIGAGSYRLSLEAPVSSSEDQATASDRVFQIVDELDVSWCYLFDRPFLSAQKTIDLSNEPDHWSSNFREVQAAIKRAAGRPYGVVTDVRIRSWMRTSFLPLEKLEAIREALFSITY